MMELFILLSSIALIDSLSVVPIASVPLVMLVSGRRPVAGSLAFIAGIFFTYFPFGLLLILGLDAIFHTLAGHFTTWWNKEPELGEVVLQILVGIVLIIFGRRLWNKRGKQKQKSATVDLTPGQAFTLAVMINLTGMWGALPYFAAIAQILKTDTAPAVMVLLLLFYNSIFVLPLASFLFIRVLMGKRSERWFQSINTFLSHWSGRLILIILLILGFLLIVDGVGWLIGHPLVPIGFPE